MSILVAQGDTVRLQFPVFDIDGVTLVTGLVDGDFSRYLAVENATSIVVSVIVEIGASGRYYIEFVPDADGLWYVEVKTPEEDVLSFEVVVGFTPGASVAVGNAVWSTSLPGAFAAESAGERLASTDDRVELLEAAIVMASLVAAVGSTASNVQTSATQPDGFYDGLTVVVVNAFGSVVRRVSSYAGGAFAVSPDLPFVPLPGDQVVVLGSLGEVAVDGDSELAVKLCEIHRILGLDPEAPLCVSKTGQVAGDINLTQTEVGKTVRVQRQG